MASFSPIHPLLRQAAPRLTRHFFASRQCPQKPSPLQTQNRLLSQQPFKSKRQTAFLQAFRSQSTTATDVAAGAGLREESPARLGRLTNRLKNGFGTLKENLTPDESPAERGKYYPKLTRKIVAYWLIGSAASVFGLVVFGGLTRLTESGLSITEWRPVTGTIPPLTDGDWANNFVKYRESPEFQKLNPNMTISEFKRIFWMEYVHRLWGRVVGLTFLIPTIYFIARRRVSVPIARNLVLINFLIAAQGFVGWWMVKSGLKDDLFQSTETPRVSQYRLATHLGMAFATYTSMLWNGLAILRERHLVINSRPGRATKFIERLTCPQLRPFRIGVFFLSGLVSVTVLSGALVAGLDAGLIYNEFPYMGLGLTPPYSELFNAFYSRLPAPHADLWWRNALENPSMVQLDHRILAVSTFTAVNLFFFYGRLAPSVRTVLPKGARRALTAAMGLVWMQATLGLTTLLYLVPTWSAAAHQAGALALLTSVVVLGSRVWGPARLMRMIKARARSTAARVERAKLGRNPGQRALANHRVKGELGETRMGMGQTA